jgi:hypothetical protein
VNYFNAIQAVEWVLHCFAFFIYEKIKFKLIRSDHTSDLFT